MVYSCYPSVKKHDSSRLQTIDAFLLQVIERGTDQPIFGICMGNQLTGLAAGANSYKLPLGNRSVTTP